MRWLGRSRTSRSATPERLGSDVLLVGLTSVGSAALGFLLVPVLARGAGLDAYGLFVQFQTTVDLAATVALMGLPYALLRYLPGRGREEGAPALAAAAAGTLAVAAIFSLLLLVASPWLADAVFAGARAPILAAAAMLPLQAASLLYANHFRVRRRMGLFASFTTALSVGRLLAVGLAVRLDADLEGILLAAVAFQALHALAAFLLATAMEGAAVPRLRALGPYLRFGAPTLPGVLSGWVVAMSDRYVIGLFLGPAAVGVYHPAVLLGSLLQMLVVPFDVALTSAAAQAHNQGDPARVRTILAQAASGYAWLATPALVGASLLAEPALALLVGPGEAAAQAAAVVPYAAGAWLCYGVLVLTASPAFFLHERTHWAAGVWGGSAALNLALNLLLVPRLGVVGSGVATLASYVVALLVAWALAARLAPLAVPWRPFARALLACVPMAAVILLLAPATAAGAVGAALVAGTAYALAQLLLPGGKAAWPFRG